MPARVPVVDVHVELALVDSAPADHVIYLIADAPDIDRYLQSPRRFFPMSSDGVPRIVNKEQIIWLRAPHGPAAGDVTAVRTETILELVDGSRIEGFVRLDGTGWRLSDALNDSSPFLRLDETSGTYFINKRMIRFALPR
jgi:hypothetical protein